MKRTHYALSVCAALTALPLTAVAQDSAPQSTAPVYNGLYATISGDLTWANDLDNGGGGNVAIGAPILPGPFGNFRLEGEFGYHGMNNSHYETYMGNLYYDLQTIPPFSGGLKVVPYVGAGLGDATVHFAENDAAGRYNIHGDAFAYQFMAGLSFLNPSMPNTEWLVGYRYQGSDHVDGTDNAGFGNNERISADNLEVGLRFHF